MPSAHSQGHQELPHTSPVPSAHTLRIKLELGVLQERCQGSQLWLSPARAREPSRHTAVHQSRCMTSSYWPWGPVGVVFSLFHVTQVPPFLERPEAH